MFVSDGHVVLDILLVRSNYDGRGASQKVSFRVNAATPHGEPREFGSDLIAGGYAVGLARRLACSVNYQKRGVRGYDS